MVTILVAGKRCDAWGDWRRPRLGGSVGAFRIVDGIPVIPARGAVVTKEMIDRLIEEEDLEAIKLAAGKK
jgi:hypothetical protein